MPTQVPLEPHENDVLMGRGGRNNQHSGNHVLRQLARAEGENYRVASKKGKSAISRMLVRQMRELNPPARYALLCVWPLRCSDVYAQLSQPCHCCDRFLKRVQQTAQWEEVSEDTAREKASQVLRDAVAGLLESKEEEADEEQEETSDDPLPVRTVSAPVSLDEHDQTARLPSVRQRSTDFQPPRSSRSESSASNKRQRYSIQASAFHSFDDRYSTTHHPPPQPVVGYSPIRRHSEERYASSSFSDPTNRRSSSLGTMPPQYAPDDRPRHRPQGSGNQFELDLLHGELLESDVEDEGPLPPETHSRTFPS
jgi:hypothetical protein